MIVYGELITTILEIVKTYFAIGRWTTVLIERLMKSLIVVPEE